MQLKFYLLHTKQVQFMLYSLRHSAALGLPHDAASICLVSNVMNKVIVSLKQYCMHCYVVLSNVF